MKIDPKATLRKGDIVTVRGALKYKSAPGETVHLVFPNYSTAVVDRAEICELVGRSFKAGAYCKYGDGHAVVIAQHGDEVWIEAIRESGLTATKVVKSIELEFVADEVPEPKEVDLPVETPPSLERTLVGGAPEFVETPGDGKAKVW